MFRLFPNPTIAREATQAFCFGLLGGYLITEQLKDIPAHQRNEDVLLQGATLRTVFSLLAVLRLRPQNYNTNASAAILGNMLGMTASHLKSFYAVPVEGLRKFSLS